MLIEAAHGYKVDPETGAIFGSKGKMVGCVKRDGYVRLNTGRGATARGFSAHRLMWEAVHGPIPDGLQIDHINGDRTDNRISNLRVVTGSVNCQNRRNARGATRHTSGKWQAYITINGRGVYLGLYATEEEARAVYVAQKRLHHEGCTL